MIDLITVIKAFPSCRKGAFAAVVPLLLLACLAATPSAFAQVPKLLSVTQADKQESGAEATPVSPEQQLEIAKLALTKALAERNRALAATRGNTRQDAKERYRLLDGLVTRLNSQLSLINERQELRRSRTAVEQKAKSWAGFQVTPPYSILMVDELMRSLLTARAKAQGLSTNHELFAQQATQYRESAKHAQEIERLVTNWTHTNAMLRRIVRVGVAYGSPATKVRDVLVECGNAHGQILKDPPPEALFEDFGDSSLIFALYFWVEHGAETNPLQVASDLRFMIDQRFAEEEIAIAFPQRDIHLDTRQPLRVEVVT